ncbi:2-dehydro-3-deoxyphosphogluconate aldolase [Candidatus Aerophobetes bacterium]|uniref:2-dehydro-3-deoxyphosphogluconate aldolase n=1 Tax=Aerophobetes bacterium TaxID=2030807 RepID=A0A662D1T2_UNCAE|nr:MAG: 2-dehydro-3-deoxyphosphogluconate aldolase [Candidatus Aerophobetes bacterium]
MRDKSSNLKMLLDIGLVPVVRASSADDAMRIVDAIREGGVNTIEITMTVPNAIGVMEEVAKKFGDEVLLGAGTVLDAETARASILAGAEFVVGPCLDEELIRICKRYAKIVIPGAMTPTEILRAWERGADIVKVFPAGNLGGPKYIRAIKAPLPQILLNPTGGVNLENAGEFIKAGASVISVGSALVDKKAVAERRFEILTEKARRFLEEVKKARVG